MKKLKPCINAVASKMDRWAKRSLPRPETAAARVVAVRFAAETNYELRLSAKTLPRDPGYARRVIVVSGTPTQRVYWRRLDVKQIPLETIRGMAAARVL